MDAYEAVSYTHLDVYKRQDEDSLKAFVKQLVDGYRFTDDHIGNNLDAQLFEGINFPLDDCFWQPELRNAIHQHAARHVEGFKYGDFIACLLEVARAGKP